MFTIWKKLFYLLDQNRNGYIDRKEFTNVFVDHLEDMMVTSDGQKLMHLLFGVDKNQDSSISPALEQITALFSVMDTNRDNEIEWSEYLRFLQQRQQELFATTEEIDENPAIDIPEVKYEQKQELRRKNCEDGRTAASNSADHSAIECNQDEIPPEKMREVMSRGIHSKQEPAAPKRLGKISSSEEKLLKLQYSNQEQNRLQQQITSLETILTIERRRYAELAADRQALMRSYQQLHLKHQNEIIQEQTKTKWMKQTIERQQQQLEEREKVRQNQNQASIVLQSTFRSRATDVGGDVGGESNGLHASNSDREDEIGNPSCPETEQNIIITESGGLEIDMVSGEDITDNSSNQAANGSDVQEGGLDAPDCSDFRIIHNLIENMKELVALSAVTEGATTHTQPESQVPDSTLDDIDEKAAEFDTTSLSIASEPTVSDVKAILRQQNADEGMPMQDVVSSETSRDDTSTTIDQAQQPLAEAFNTDAAVGDFAIPDDSDDESSIRHSSDGEDSGGSSVDSTDLMMEADAMTTMQDIPESAGSKSARHTRKTTRMDSSVLLADLDQLNAREDPTAPLGN
ncbi:hypothetical protein PC115_g1840 [Phytophthora cactorum]|uniref:EF-hand domain-containing protein n=1 Tax=Phytophthora cactorum TaxID=29920 RepID=A0A8T1DJ34_9STRA|nr:hypothetical protein PC115_g1840 [Phytophthora cactorum]